ncbi:Uncharacterised protein [Anaerotruncus sp. 2789STDY5834896]|uniref:Uncharacterized protein n=1 Tax=uncultured Anaerotruncus sp. TaxID=905011 RepID=A0A1C6FJV4_9FIRM|nr:Uncharacterised protein [uncultured Anaerotruncus sp.]
MRPKTRIRYTTRGDIVRVDQIDGRHYPVLAFCTADGRQITSRVRTSLPLEQVLNPRLTQRFLQRPLPIRNVLVRYCPGDPWDFYAAYL